LAFLKAAFFPKELLEQCTKITPVPLHKDKLHLRGYNQSFLLAKELSVLLHLPCDAQLLERTRQTDAQAKMTREERLKNVKNAFVATKDVNGEIILLIDDVLTTGATVDACAKALKKNGAEKVFVLTVATGNKKK